MQSYQYRIYHENTTLGPESLGNIKDIVIEQEINMAWEARLTFNVFLDDMGNWSSETDGMLKTYSRIRIEIKSGMKPYVPLIDGNVVGYEFYMSSEPGESKVTIIIQDDSVLLNRDDEIIKYEKMTDDFVVQSIFSRFALIPEIESQNFKKSPLNPPLDFIQRGTAVLALRQIANRQGMSFYVLPSPIPGKSIGCFSNFPTEPNGLSPLILLGSNRNIEFISIKTDAQKLSNFEASSMNISSKGVVSSVSNAQDIPLLGDQIGLESTKSPPTRRLDPYQDEIVDLDNAVLAEAKRSSYVIQAEGKIINNKYPDILRPYQVISVLGVKSNLCGNYLVKAVIHTITPSNYNQTFKLMRNARTSGRAIPSSGGIF